MDFVVMESRRYEAMDQYYISEKVCDTLWHSGVLVKWAVTEKVNFFAIIPPSPNPFSRKCPLL